MRFLKLLFKAYGPFDDLVLDFSKDKQFHIIFGNNEAGKSTALRGVYAWLFGIPNNTKDNFLHDNTDLRIGGHLCFSDEQEFAFYRRKGSKSTILDLQGNKLDDPTLESHLRSIPEDIYRSRFEISHKTLEQGGDELLKEKGEIGAGLFSAATGINLYKIIKELNDQSKSLFLKGGKRLINQTIKDYNQSKKDITQLSLSSTQFLENEKALGEAKEHKSVLDKELKVWTNNKSRFERFQKAYPKVSLLKDLLKQKSEMGPVKKLPSLFAKERLQLAQRLKDAEDEQVKYTRTIERIEQQINQLTISQQLLEQRDTINNLRERLGMHNKAAKDRSTLLGEKREIESAMDSIYKEIQPDLTLDINSIHISQGLRIKIQSSGNEYHKLIARKDEIEQSILDSEIELSNCNTLLESLTPSQDTNRLKAAISRISTSDELGRERDDTKLDLRSLEKTIQTDLSKLGLWKGTLEELEKLAIPPDDLVSRFEQHFDGLKSDSQRSQDKIKGATERLDRIKTQIKEIRQKGDIPAESDLERARKHRDDGWELIRRVWLGNEDLEKEISKYDEDNPLHLAFEKSMKQSDIIADAIRRESRKVAQLQTLLKQEEDEADSLDRLKKQDETINSEVKKLKGSWDKQWATYNFRPYFPKDMRDWLGKQKRLIDLAEKAKEYRFALEKIELRINKCRTELTEHLLELGQEEPGKQKTLAMIIEICQSCVDAIEDNEKKRANLESDKQSINKRLNKAIQNRENVNMKLKDWQEVWEMTTEDFGLKKAYKSDEASAVLVKIDEYYSKQQQKNTLLDRINGINQDAEQFFSDVKGLAKRIAPDIYDLKPEEIVSRLFTNLEKTNRNVATLKGLEKQLDEIRESLSQTHDTIGLARKRLDELCQQAGCSNYDELEEAEKRSEEYLKLEERILVLEEQINLNAGGIVLQDFVKEVEDQDAESLPGLFNEADNKEKELNSEREGIIGKIATFEERKSGMDGTSEAAEIEEQAQSHLSVLRDATEKYMRFRMALVLLRREIERYRKKNQDAILSRASDLFSQITLRSFSSLQTDFNAKDELVFVGIRPSGEKVSVEGMSDGSRDQLYLALRMATLENYLPSNESMPLIFDDILIRFDNQRSVEILKILAELSNRTQVLFFTHHSHLVDIAKDQIDETILQIYKIES